MCHPSLIVIVTIENRINRANWEGSVDVNYNLEYNEIAAERSGVLYCKASKLEELSKEKMAKKDAGCVKTRQVVRLSPRRGCSSAMTHFPFYELVSSSFLFMPTNHIYTYNFH